MKGLSIFIRGLSGSPDCRLFRHFRRNLDCELNHRSRLFWIFCRTSLDSNASSLDASSSSHSFASTLCCCCCSLLLALLILLSSSQARVCLGAVPGYVSAKCLTPALLSSPHVQNRFIYKKKEAFETMGHP